jgi:hypothetical protein
VTTLFSSRGCDRSVSVRDPETQRKIRIPADQLASAVREARKSGKAADFERIGVEIAKKIAAAQSATDLNGKEIIAVPFALGVTNESDARFLSAVFSPVYGRLAVERADGTGLVTSPLPANTDEALVALGQKLEAGFVLGGWITKSGEASLLTVRLMKTEDASVAWAGQYPLAGSDPAALSGQIATAVLAAVPKE